MNWDLSDLGVSDFGAELAQVLAQAEQFGANRGRLEANITAQDFYALVRELEELSAQASRVYAQVSLRFATDTQDPLIQAELAQVEEAAAQLQNLTLFFSLWWKDLDEANATRLLQEAGDYRYWLTRLRVYKPYTLSEPEERVINLKNTTGSGFLSNFYDLVTGRYVFNFEGQELTRGELAVHFRSADPARREAAYQENFRVYGQDALVLGSIYSALVRDWKNENLTLRGFASPIAARNLGNDIPDGAVEALLEAAVAGAPVFQEYFRKKAERLGMSRLRRYDIYAPVGELERTYSLKEAQETVLAAFSEFDSEFANHAQKVFAAGHIDSEVKKGKRGGAFCYSVTPAEVPYVMLNFQGQVDDVATMAHELGHAVHTLFAREHSLFTFHAPLPLAESASTFGEMILLDRFMAEADPATQTALRFRQLDDNYATILRQAYFAIFERDAHARIAQGASTPELSQLYLENLRSQFGDSLDLSDDFQYEWVSIPHIFHTPFYVYAYSFGQLLVLALYQRYQEEGPEFIPVLKRILSAGGSVAPAELLHREGFQIEDPEFWAGGFKLLESWVKELR